MKQIFIIPLILFSMAAQAQLDRRVANMTKSPTVSEKKAEKVDYVDAVTTRLKEELALDAFQEAVISNLLRSNQESESRIATEDIPLDSKYEKMANLREKMNQEIKEVLTPEQLAKLEKLNDKKKKK